MPIEIAGVLNERRKERRGIGLSKERADAQEMIDRAQEEALEEILGICDPMVVVRKKGREERARDVYILEKWLGAQPAKPQGLPHIFGSDWESPFVDCCCTDSSEEPMPATLRLWAACLVHWGWGAAVTFLGGIKLLDKRSAG
jgi:hypothetical protein